MAKVAKNNMHSLLLFVGALYLYLLFLFLFLFLDESTTAIAITANNNYYNNKHSSKMHVIDKVKEKFKNKKDGTQHHLYNTRHGGGHHHRILVHDGGGNCEHGLAFGAIAVSQNLTNTGVSKNVCSSQKDADTLAMTECEKESNSNSTNCKVVIKIMGEGICAAIAKSDLGGYKFVQTSMGLEAAEGRALKNCDGECSLVASMCNDVFSDNVVDGDTDGKKKKIDKKITNKNINKNKNKNHIRGGGHHHRILLHDGGGNCEHGLAFGAIAVSQNLTNTGVSKNVCLSQKDADTLAMTECEKESNSNCTVIIEIMGEGQCAAIAKSDLGGYEWVKTSMGLEAAEGRALKNCDGECTVEASMCNDVFSDVVSDTDGKKKKIDKKNKKLKQKQKSDVVGTDVVVVNEHDGGGNCEHGLAFGAIAVSEGFKNAGVSKNVCLSQKDAGTLAMTECERESNSDCAVITEVMGEGQCAAIVQSDLGEYDWVKTSMGLEAAEERAMKICDGECSLVASMCNDVFLDEPESEPVELPVGEDGISDVDENRNGWIAGGVVIGAAFANGGGIIGGAMGGVAGGGWGGNNNNDQWGGQGGNSNVIVINNNNNNNNNN